MPRGAKPRKYCTCFVGHTICSSNIHVSHVNTSYGRFPLVQSLNIFVLVSGNPQQNTSAFRGNGKSGRNKQEQCIVWIPLQCGVPVAKRANSYSAAMVMTCKTGESPSNGAHPKVVCTNSNEQNQINSREIQWSIENFDEILVLNASVRNWSSQQHYQVIWIEYVSSASYMTPVTTSNQIKYRQIQVANPLQHENY